MRRELNRTARLRRWFASHRIAVALAAGIIAVACTAGMLYYSTLPPASVRQFDAAVVAFERQEYNPAIAQLNRSIADASDSPQAWLLRGRSYAKIGQYNDAVKDVLRAHKLAPHDTQIMAFLGYCCSKGKYQADAIYWYLQAIKNGMESADVYNNLGYSYYHDHRKRLSKAKESLDTAIRLDQGHQAALHNRALLDSFEAEKEKRPPNQGMECIEKAIACGDPSVELYCDAAQIYLVASKFDAKWNESMVGHLRLAIEAGADLKSLQSYPALAEILNERPELMQASRRKRSTFIPDRTIRVVDPLD